jgi:transglutaminase-like putative cysteine protease
MIRLQFAIGLKYEITGSPGDFIFNIHAAQTPSQQVVAEAVALCQQVEPEVYTDPSTGNRYMRVKALPGTLTVRYDATVDITHHFAPVDELGEVPIAELPREVLHYIYPSRYCESDRLRRHATREFGHLRQGYSRVQAIQDWVRQRTAFTIGSSNASTSALDTLVDQAGVCRDFAHLMIAMCRALNIPARFVSGIDYGASPELGPPDFHAYVEVYLGERWYLFDPTGISLPMGLVRIGTGRDAADVAFATIFGSVKSFMPVVSISAIDDPAQGLILPRPSADAVSTHGDLVISR